MTAPTAVRLYPGDLVRDRATGTVGIYDGPAVDTNLSVLLLDAQDPADLGTAEVPTKNLEAL